MKQSSSESIPENAFDGIEWNARNLLGTGVYYYRSAKTPQKWSSKIWIFCEEDADAGATGAHMYDCRGRRKMEFGGGLLTNISGYDEYGEFENASFQTLPKRYYKRWNSDNDWSYKGKMHKYKSWEEDSEMKLPLGKMAGNVGTVFQGCQGVTGR